MALEAQLLGPREQEGAVEDRDSEEVVVAEPRTESVADRLVGWVKRANQRFVVAAVATRAAGEAADEKGRPVEFAAECWASMPIAAREWPIVLEERDVLAAEGAGLIVVAAAAVAVAAALAVVAVVRVDVAAVSVRAAAAAATIAGRL